MTAPRIITLLSDFGLSDPYVGILKGVIAQVNPTVHVVDLTHHIPPQNIALARFALMQAYPHFPAGTVHIAVVDPGVGSQRRAIAVALGSDSAQPLGFLVGPDNGLFSGVVDTQAVLGAVELTQAQYWRAPTPSRTFHGRDIFAPVAAHLASGVPWRALGPEIAVPSLVKLQMANPVLSKPSGDRPGWLTGYIQAIDHFGNGITTISGDAVQARQWSVRVGQRTILSGLTYSEASPGDLLALVGSHGWVEVAVNGGRACDRLALAVGDEVRVVVQK